MGEEVAAVERAIADGHQASDAYVLLGDTLSLKWNRITGGDDVGGLPYKMGRYLALAAENWDHFAPFAVTAYKVGHQIAMEQRPRFAVPGSPRPIVAPASNRPMP
ncbi:hypothetical protein [Aestuariimicrobium sp. Y1814]|uniref:hypothetical protein n=1 Tax=Aestuariimicrobium sp. Y1814 TaxID=3418742 RepID=UPI003DA6CF1B